MDGAAVGQEAGATINAVYAECANPYLSFTTGRALVSNEDKRNIFSECKYLKHQKSVCFTHLYVFIRYTSCFCIKNLNLA